MKVYVATDHAGYELKNSIVTFLRDELGHEVIDCGATMYDPEDDYPVFIKRAAESVAKDPEHARGIIFGGSGQGEAIVANKQSAVRAALYYGGPLDIVRLSREHNNTNILSLGARFVDYDTAKVAVRLWLETPFSEDSRHVRRIAQIF
jgi:ribose 5-phosphate isomerase B